MKRFIFILSLSILIFSCSNDTITEKTTEMRFSQETKDGETAPVPNSLKNNSDYKKGLELIAQLDCLSCHKIDDINVGPSYRDVANKYEANTKNISMLADKIIKGGSGVWGQVPMTPHTNLSKREAEQIVKYIMLLKRHS